jgi:hypothetical protein
MLVGEVWGKGKEVAGKGRAGSAVVDGGRSEERGE